MLQFWQFSSKNHLRAPIKFKIFWGMPPDPLEVVGPRAHQVPWLAPASRYAPVQHYKCARVRVCLHACVCEYMLPHKWPSARVYQTRYTHVTRDGQLTTFMYLTFQASLTSIISMLNHLTDSDGVYYPFCSCE